MGAERSGLGRKRSFNFSWSSMYTNDSLDMLDPSWSETSARQILSCEIDQSVLDKGRAIRSSRPPDYDQAVCMRKAMRELNLMRNLGHPGVQNWSSPQKETQSLKPEFVFETTAKEASPDSTPVHINTNHFLQSLENGHANPQHIQHPAPKRHPAQSVDGKMSFFQWQVRQEARHLEGLNPEILKVQDEDGDTFLHIAVAKGRRALAYLLAWKMASVGSLDLKEQNGQTALQVAVATDQHLIVHDLLLYGAQVNTADRWGRSPLHVCAEKGHILTLQSIQGALYGSCRPIDVDVFNYDGLTPLHTAVLSHNAIVKELRSLTCLHSAKATELDQRRKLQRECIKALLHMGACCGTRDLKSGRTLLHMASAEANLELFHLFLNQPSSLSIVNVKTFNGNTALHLVSSLPSHIAQVDCVRLLMRRGADPSAKNIENELPAHLVPEGPVGDKVRQILRGKDVST